MGRCMVTEVPRGGLIQFDVGPMGLVCKLIE